MTDRQKRGRILLISIVSVIYLFFLYYVLQVTLDMDEHPAHTAMEAFTQYGFKRIREAPVSVLPVPGKFFRYGGILTLSFGFAVERSFPLPERAPYHRAGEEPERPRDRRFRSGQVLPCGRT